MKRKGIRQHFAPTCWLPGNIVTVPFEQMREIRKNWTDLLSLYTDRGH